MAILRHRPPVAPAALPLTPTEPFPMRFARPRRAWPALVVALMASAPAIAALPKVPEGFKVRLVAAVPAVTYPCQIATGPDGALFVAEDPMDQVGPYEADLGRILLFKDGKDPVVFAQGFRAVFGMVWHDGAIYVMNMPRLTVLRDTDGDGKADSRKELFTDLGPGPRPGALNDHIVSGLQFGMDGLLYISVGDKGVPGVHGPDGRTAQLIGGGTMRCRPDGTGIEVISTGTRNHLEPNLDPSDNLFTYDNTDDGDGWWTRITHHVDGGYYGYPYDYHTHADRHLPRMTEYGSGSPCGGVLYKEDAWPAEYRGRAFWAEWGKRHVAAVKFAPDGASFKVADYQKFLEAGDGDEFRPIDLALSFDGKTMYVADWGMGGWGSKTEKVGRVFAVTYEGKVEQKPRGKDTDPIADQIKSLSHPAFIERMRAQAALVKGGREAIAPIGAALADPKTDPVALRHLVWALDGLVGGSGEAEWIITRVIPRLKGDPRAQAARVIGMRGWKSGVDPLIDALKDRDPVVRLQAIIALGRIKDAKAIPALMSFLADTDPFLAFSARSALRRIGDWKVVGSELAKATDPKVRAGVLAALELQYSTDAVALLNAEVADRSKPVAERGKALAFLAQAHRKAPPWDGKWWGTRPSQGKPPAKTVAWEGTTAVVEAVRAALSDADAPVRLAAVAAVKETNDREALPKLRERFSVEADHTVRRDIALALGAMDDRAALPLLIAALRDAKAADMVREAALASVEKIGTDLAIKALIDVLSGPGLPPDRQARVVAALGRSKAKSAVSAIVGVLASPDAKVRASAAEALGKIGDTSATPKVRALLSDPDLDVRKAVIAGLGVLKDRESIPALIAAADAEPTRFEATLALAAIPDVRALQLYLRGLTDKSQDVRKASATAMGLIRDQAAPVLDRLAARKELPPATLPELRRIYGTIRPVKDWHVAGPFKLKEAPPVRGNRPVDVRKPIDVGGGKTVEWKSTAAIDSQGQVDLNRVFADGHEKSAFGYAELTSDTARPARMAVGSDDTLHVWLNGKEVYKFDGNRGFTAEEDSVDIALVKGVNRLLVRCGNTDGPWAFSIGVSATTGDHAFLKGPAIGGFDPDKFRAAALPGKGKADHGKALFDDLKGVACLKCHAIAGKGGLVGPELSGVGLKYAREELITSVLYPSQRISSGYEPVILATADGRVLTGIVKAETTDAIEIEDAEAKRIKVSKADIDARKMSDVSLMPNGLAEGLTATDFADLIAYLETLKDTAGLHGPGGSSATKPSAGR